MTFEEVIEALEVAIEDVQRFEATGAGDFDVSGRIPLIFDRLTGVQNAIDDWRQG